MDANLRPSGIEGLGDMSWGTHFCLFYETEEDLLDFFIPFFKSGLEHQEFCLCVASEPLIAEEVERAMRQAIPDFERYVAEGQLEITPNTGWYLKEGYFDEQRMLQGWIDKLDHALAKGFLGLRFAANILLEERDWENFAQYEGKLEESLQGLQIEVLCAYNLNRYSAANMLDVIHHHQFTFARQDGTWEPIEGAQLKRAHEEVLKLNAELERRVAERTAELAAANEQLRREITERKRSETRLQAAIDAVDIVLWERDLSSGQITWLGHYEKLLGFALSELNDKTLADFEKRVHPEDIEELRKIRQQALEQRSEYSHEYRVIWRDSSIHWIRAQGRFIYNEAGQPVRLYGAVLDITERKKSEEALQTSERVLREAEVLGHTGSWEQNLVTGEIFNTEENLRLFFGDNRGKGKDFEDYAEVVHPDDREYVLHRRAELLEDGPSDIEYRVVWPDGSVHVIFGRATVVRNESGKAIRVYGTNVDITERKRAENAIRESEELLQLVLATLPVGVAVTDLADNIILANPEAKHIWGDVIVSGSERRARSLGFWYDSGKRIAPEEWASVRALTKGETSLNELIEIETFDGVHKIIQNSSAPIRNSEGVIAGAVFVNEDVTRRKQAEEALRKSEQLLREAESLGHTGSWEKNLVTGEIFHTKENLRLFFGDDGSTHKVTFLADYNQAIHPDDREYVMQHRVQLLAEGGPRDIEFRVVLPDGSVHILFSRATVVYDELGQAIRVYGTNMDITERKQAETTIRSLLQISENLHRNLDVDKLLESLIIEAMKLTDSELGWVGLPTEKGMTLIRHISHNFEALPFEYTWAPGIGWPGWVLVHKIPYISNDAGSDNVIVPEIRERFGVKSGIDTPILDAQGNILGFFEVNNKQTNGGYNERDVEILMAVSRIASIALQNAMSYANLERTKEELKKQAVRSETLARIAARLNKQLDLNAVIDAVCQEVVDTFKVSQATMSLYDPKSDLLVYAGGVNIPPEYANKIEPIRRTQFEEFVRTLGPVVVVPDIQALPNVPNAEFSARFDVRTVVTADMRRDQELIGVLVLGVNGQVREFDPDELTLLKAISDQAAQAIANAQLLKTANEQREELRNLSTRLVQVQEAERRAITTELHDRVGQNLTGLSIAIQNMKASLSNQSQETVAAEINDAQTLLEGTTRHIRDIMAELYLPELEDHGLAAALETYAERVASRANLDLVVDLPETHLRLSSDVRVALFRAAQEAISNVLKHADATQLEISLQRENGRVRLRVEDNGQGFEPSPESPKETPSWGLKIMRERIESIGGKVRIESKPGEGTRVTFEIERFS